MVRRDGWSSPAAAERHGGDRIRLTGRLVHVYFLRVPAFSCALARRGPAIRDQFRAFAHYMRVASRVSGVNVGERRPALSCTSNSGRSIRPGASLGLGKRAIESHQPQCSGNAFDSKHLIGKTPGVFRRRCFESNEVPHFCYGCDWTAGIGHRLCGAGRVHTPSKGCSRPQRRFPVQVGVWPSSSVAVEAIARGGAGSSDGARTKTTAP